MEDIVYIFGKGSLWNDNEIRYSLRSLEKYFFPNYNKVFVVGESLDWFQNITVIPATDFSTNKTLNGVHKISVAAASELVSERFILMNDDFIFMNPTQAIKPYYKWDMAKTMRLHPSKGGYYYESLKNTRDILEEWGYTNIIDWEVHYPIAFQKDKLLKVIERAKVYKKPYLVRTIYCTVYGVIGIEAMDFKINNLKEYAVQKMRNEKLVSLSDLAVGHAEVQNWLAKKLPEASSFEKDDGVGLYQKAVRPGLRFYATVNFEYAGEILLSGNILPPHVVAGIINNPKYNSKWRQE